MPFLYSSRLLTIACLVSLAATGMAHAADVSTTHPRLLMSRDDLPGIRYRCGLERARQVPPERRAGITFGAQAETYRRLLGIGDRILAGTLPLERDLHLLGLLHLISGEPEQSDKYTQYIEMQLTDPETSWLELDVVLGLDTAWDALPWETKALVGERFLPRLTPFDSGDSAMDRLDFEHKLASLALALIMLDPQVEGARPEWSADLHNIVAAGRTWIQGDFLEFYQHRGPVPTSGGEGVWENSGGVLAAEMWRHATGEDLWPALATSLGRCMEPVFYADTMSNDQAYGLLHDDGHWSPVNPVFTFRPLVAAIPWIVAERSGNAAARWVARRGLPPVQDSVMPAFDRLQWVRLVYGNLGEAPVDRAEFPLSRYFDGGWVVMRDGWAPGGTLLVFDVGQPFRRSRQHFDAGQFQIHRRGPLAIDSGDDVTYEAVPSRGGASTFGPHQADWDRYFQATIAHNCITVFDRNYTQMLYGEPWLARGNQRVIAKTYRPGAEELDTRRATGRGLAFETHPQYSYALADLTEAYPPEIITRYLRSILFLHGQSVIVLDRVRTTRKGKQATWHLQLPAKPTVHRKPLSSTRQVHGVNDSAGIWELGDDHSWIEVAHAHSQLLVSTVLPTGATRRVVGGPMREMTVPSGASAGKAYHGGDPQGYEHRLGPASVLRAPNAAYTLGSPLTLGPQFGLGATWGRYDVIDTQRDLYTVFLHVLVPCDKKVEKPPSVECYTRDGEAYLTISTPEQTSHVKLNLAINGPPGNVAISAADGPEFAHALTEEVETAR